MMEKPQSLILWAFQAKLQFYACFQKPKKEISPCREAMPFILEKANSYILRVFEGNAPHSMVKAFFWQAEHPENVVFTRIEDCLKNKEMTSRQLLKSWRKAISSMSQGLSVIALYRINGIAL